MAIEDLEEINLEKNRSQEKRDCWCYKCKKFYNNCKDVAK